MICEPIFSKINGKTLEKRKKGDKIYSRNVCHTFVKSHVTAYKHEYLISPKKKNYLILRYVIKVSNCFHSVHFPWIGIRNGKRKEKSIIWFLHICIHLCFLFFVLLTTKDFKTRQDEKEKEKKNVFVFTLKKFLIISH